MSDAPWAACGVCRSNPCRCDAQDDVMPEPSMNCVKCNAETHVRNQRGRCPNCEANEAYAAHVQEVSPSMESLPAHVREHIRMYENEARDLRADKKVLEKSLEDANQAKETLRQRVRELEGHVDRMRDDMNEARDERDKWKSGYMGMREAIGECECCCVSAHDHFIGNTGTREEIGQILSCIVDRAVQDYAREVATVTKERDEAERLRQEAIQDADTVDYRSYILQVEQEREEWKARAEALEQDKAAYDGISKWWYDEARTRERENAALQDEVKHLREKLDGLCPVYEDAVVLLGKSLYMLCRVCKRWHCVERKPDYRKARGVLRRGEGG